MMCVPIAYAKKYHTVVDLNLLLGKREMSRVFFFNQKQIVAGKGKPKRTDACQNQCFDFINVLSILQTQVQNFSPS
jgi:hypothetical protein